MQGLSLLCCISGGDRTSFATDLRGFTRIEFLLLTPFRIEAGVNSPAFFSLQAVGGQERPPHTVKAKILLVADHEIYRAGLIGGDRYGFFPGLRFGEDGPLHGVLG
jgi:hypothetical protein